MSEAMEAEFDAVAEWTAQVAADLGPQYHVPAGCRGSGSPVALDWLIEHMELQPGTRLLDSGAGVGGPAAYAAQSRSVHPLLVEPEPGACRAARKLFDYPVVCADGAALPLRDEMFDAAWSLGVLCTTPNQLTLLRELRRAVRSNGHIGPLTFVAHRADVDKQVEGNHFPTPEGLLDLIAGSGLHVERRIGTSDLPAMPEEWNQRTDTVEKALSDRYGHTQTWRIAERQSSTIGDLLSEGTLTGELLVLRRQPTPSR